MTIPPITLDQALALVEQLTPADQVRLIARLTPRLAQTLTHPAPPRTPRSGRFAPHGPASSADDIDAARRDIGAGFPRKDGR